MPIPPPQRIDLPTDALLLNNYRDAAPNYFSPLASLPPFDPSAYYQVVVDDLESLHSLQNNNNNVPYAPLKVLLRPTNRSLFFPRTSTPEVRAVRLNHKAAHDKARE